MLKKLHRNGKGFTLIELMIVIAIIAILAAIAIPNFMTARRKAKISAAKQTLSNYATGLEVYATDEEMGDSKYPVATDKDALATALKNSGAMKGAKAADLTTGSSTANLYTLAILSIDTDGTNKTYTWTVEGRSW